MVGDRDAAPYRPPELPPRRLQRSPREKSQSILPKGGGGVPSGPGALRRLQAARCNSPSHSRARRGVRTSVRRAPAATRRLRIRRATRAATAADPASARVNVLVLKSPPISTGVPAAMRIDGVEHGTGL